MVPKPEVSGLDEYRRLLALVDERRFEEILARGRLLLEGDDHGGAVEARVHNLICWTLAEGLKRPCAEAVLHGDEAVRLAGALPDPALQAESLVNLGAARSAQTEWEEAASAYRQLQALLVTHPGALRHGGIIAALNLGCVAACQDNFAEALRHYDAAEALCSGDEHAFFRTEIWRRQAVAQLRSGHIVEAERLLAQVDEGKMNSRGYSLWSKCQYRMALCRLEMARGHWSRARSQLAGTLALARELADLAAMAEATCMLAVMDYSEGKKEGWRRARLAINYAIASGRKDVASDVRRRLRTFLDQEGG